MLDCAQVVPMILNATLLLVSGLAASYGPDGLHAHSPERVGPLASPDLTPSSPAVDEAAG